LSFQGDVAVLALVWGGLLLASTYAFWQLHFDTRWDDCHIDRRWLSMILVICICLTLTSGLVFAGGSRLRASLEVIVPLLAAVGLVRIVRGFRRPAEAVNDVEPTRSVDGAGAAGA
jgi:hypothetical protein